MSSKTPTEQMIKKRTYEKALRGLTAQRQAGTDELGRCLQWWRLQAAAAGRCSPGHQSPALQLVSELTLTSGGGGAAFSLPIKGA